jgi:hypothetical protein
VKQLRSKVSRKFSDRNGTRDVDLMVRTGEVFTGKSAGCPASAGRKADPVIISTFPGSPALWAESFNGFDRAH